MRLGGLGKDKLILWAIAICLSISIALSAARAIVGFARQWKRNWDVERAIRKEEMGMESLRREVRKASIKRDLLDMKEGEEIYIFKGKGR
jgi:sulfite reductase beta subunit-like hemoprotein